MSAGADVYPQVDPPESRAVKFVCAKIRGVRLAALRIVLGIRRVPLEHDFVLAVAVKVADAAIIGGAGRGRGGKNRDVNVTIVDDYGVFGNLSLNAAGNRLDRIGAGSAAIVLITRCIGDGRRGELCCTFVNVKPESVILRVGPEKTPA